MTDEQKAEMAAQGERLRGTLSTLCEATVAHCWHLSGEQHTVPNHSDWVCCFCGKRHCVRVRTMMTGHGQHAGPSAAKGCGVILGPGVQLP